MKASEPKDSEAFIFDITTCFGELKKSEGSYLHPSKSASGKRLGLKRGAFVPLRRCSLKS